jgi:hypothetical protein
MDEGKYKVVGIEVKMNGTLSLVEKNKCKGYLERKTFSEIWVALKVKKGGRVFVEYIPFEDVEARMRK